MWCIVYVLLLIGLRCLLFYYCGMEETSGADRQHVIETIVPIALFFKKKRVISAKKGVRATPCASSGDKGVLLARFHSA